MQKRLNLAAFGVDLIKLNKTKKGVQTIASTPNAA